MATFKEKLQDVQIVKNWDDPYADHRVAYISVGPFMFEIVKTMIYEEDRTTYVVSAESVKDNKRVPMQDCKDDASLISIGQYISEKIIDGTVRLW